MGLSRSGKRRDLGESEDMMTLKSIFLSGSEEIMDSIGYYYIIKASRQTIKVLLMES